MPEALLGGPMLGGVPLIDWAALLVFRRALLRGCRVLIALLAGGLRVLWRRNPDSLKRRLVEAAVPPFRLCLAVTVFVLGSGYLGVAVVARQFFGIFAGIAGGAGWRGSSGGSSTPWGR